MLGRALGDIYGDMLEMVRIALSLMLSLFTTVSFVPAGGGEETVHLSAN